MLLRPLRRAPMMLGGVGFQAGLLALAVNLGRKRVERLAGFDACPQRSAAALLEAADAVDSDCEALGMNARQQIGDVVGDRPDHLANEAERNVELFLVLPAEVGAVVHRVDQQVADMSRRPNGDEQAVHS